MPCLLHLNDNKWVPECESCPIKKILYYNNSSKSFIGRGFEPTCLTEVYARNKIQNHHTTHVFSWLNIANWKESLTFQTIPHLKNTKFILTFFLSRKWLPTNRLKTKAKRSLNRWNSVTYNKFVTDVSHQTKHGHRLANQYMLPE